MQQDDLINQLTEDLNKVQFGVVLLPTSTGELKKILTEQINYLITTSFSRLISILYRLDISEKKLAELLSLHTDVTAGEIIAEMIIERQLQKIAAKKAFPNISDSIPEDERW